jgi:hypothetical protein
MGPDAPGEDLCPVKIGFKTAPGAVVDPAKTFRLDPVRKGVGLTQYETLILPPRVLDFMGVKK